MAGPQPAHLRQQPRSRRWLIWLVAIAVLLGAYAVALRWVTLKVESGVEASVHPLVIDTPGQEAPPRSPGPRALPVVASAVRGAVVFFRAAPLFAPHHALPGAPVPPDSSHKRRVG